MMTIRIASLLRYTDFNLTRFLHYAFQGKLRTANFSPLPCLSQGLSPLGSAGTL